MNRWICLTRHGEKSRAQETFSSELARILPPKQSLDPEQVPDKLPVTVNRNSEPVIVSATAAKDQATLAPIPPSALARPRRIFSTRHAQSLRAPRLHFINGVSIA